MEQAETKNSTENFQRLSLQFRIQHMILFISTTILIFTGIPLWCLSRPDFLVWNSECFQLLGGIRGISLIHRYAAGALVLLSAYHLLYTIFAKKGRREFIDLLPAFKDIADVTTNSLYFLGLTKKRPQFARYSYIEKFDYWAVYWGCVIMIGSGLAMVFPSQCAKYCSWLTFDLAAEIHAGEAILATLALFIWHFYNVHFNPSRFPGSLMLLHGRITKEQMIAEHPLEYEKMMLDQKAASASSD